MEKRSLLPLQLLGVVLVIVLAPQLLHVVAASAPPLSKEDRIQAAEVYAEKADGSYGSLEDTYNAVRALSAIKASTGNEKTCNYLRSLDLDDPKHAFLAAQAAAALKCPDLQKLQGAAKSLSAALENGSTLLDLYYSSGALAAGVKQGWIKSGSIENRVLSAASEKLRTLSSESSWKMKDTEEGTSRGAGLAFQTAANLVQAGATLTNPQASTLVSCVLRLYGGLEVSGENGAFFEDEETSALEATATILRGTVSLAEATGNAFDIKEKLPALAEYLLSHKDTASPSETAHLLDALHALSSNNMIVPLALSVTPTSVSPDKNTKLQVVTTTPLGDSVVPSDFTLKRATVFQKKKPVVLNKVIQSSELDFLSEVSDPAVYELTFEVTPEDPSKHAFTGPAKRLVKVITTPKLTDGSLLILEGDRVATRTSITSKPLESRLYASHLQKLHLAFKLTTPSGAPFAPQQAAVRFEHSSGVSHVFMAKRDEGSFSLQLELADHTSRFYYLSGDYVIKLQIGDSAMDTPLDWTVGTIEITFPSTPAGAAARPADISSLEKFSALPEISHIFRPAEKRPPATVSLFFTAISLLPLLGLVVGIASVGVSFSTFPKGGLAFLSAVAFHVLLLGIAVLYFLYWIKLNLFQTLGALLVLGALTVVPGHFTLSSLADSKVKTA